MKRRIEHPIRIPKDITPTREDWLDWYRTLAAYRKRFMKRHEKAGIKERDHD